MKLCPQTNLMVGVYLAAALFFSFFLNNYKAFLKSNSVSYTIYRYIYTLLCKVIKWAAEGGCSYIQIELSHRACTVAELKSIAGLAFIHQAIIIKYSCENALYKPDFDYK